MAPIHVPISGGVPETRTPVMADRRAQDGFSEAGTPADEGRPSRQQLLNLLPRQRLGERFLAAEGRGDDLAFALLQQQDFLLDRVARDELVARHHARLADAM